MGLSGWLGAPVGLLLIGAVRSRRGGKRTKEDRVHLVDEEGVSFVCERVCTSDSLLARLGGLAKVSSPC